MTKTLSFSEKFKIMMHNRMHITEEEFRQSAKELYEEYKESLNADEKSMFEELINGTDKKEC